MQIESIEIDKLAEDPNNARLHNPRNLWAIKGSLAKFGQQKPIVVDKNNVVIAGNGTLRAAKDLGWQSIDIVRTELEGYQAAAFALADNRTSELAEWDLVQLKETVDSLKLNELEIDELAFDFDYSFDDEPEGKDYTKVNKEYSEDDFNNFEHKCPKCGFEYDEKGK